ncbi:MAG: hypothetical protein H7145_05440 [Akkermansiaceae bacterium]|nr:hypothetical protein [Armatimonadota bacterium]
MAVVTLRIVGIYLNAPVTVSGAGPLSIEGVLDAAVQQYPFNKGKGFTYKSQVAFTAPADGTPPEKRVSMLAFSHNYIGDYDFDGDGTIVPPEGKTLGSKKRDAGIYTLEESKDKETGEVRVWQYYVTAPVGGMTNATILKSKTVPGDNGFLTADKFNNVADGDTITWRLVSIQPKPVATVPKDGETGPIIRTDLLYPEADRQDKTQLL